MNSRTTVREAAFAQLPIETHFTSALYERLKLAEENLDELGGERHQLLAKQFADGPQYVTVGTGDGADDRDQEVTDLEVESGEGSAETIRWEEPTANGGTKVMSEIVSPPIAA